MPRLFLDTRIFAKSCVKLPPPAPCVVQPWGALRGLGARGCRCLVTPTGCGVTPQPRQALPLGQAGASESPFHPRRGSKCQISCSCRVPPCPAPAGPCAKAALANGVQQAETKETGFYSYAHEHCDLTLLRWRSQAVPS